MQALTVRAPREPMPSAPSVKLFVEITDRPITIQVYSKLFPNSLFPLYSPFRPSAARLLGGSAQALQAGFSIPGVGSLVATLAAVKQRFVERLLHGHWWFFQIA